MTALVVCTSWLVGCSRSPSLPPGVTLHTKNGEVYLALDKDVAVNIYQNKNEDRRFVVVANREDHLSIVQVEKGGATPHSLDLFSAGKTQFCVDSGSEKEPRTLIFDQDGDGSPDLKVEGGKKYKAQVSWTEIPRSQ